MLTDNELQKLHDAELDILKCFVDICEKNGLQYYIIGGTLLGAVRHGGFIPWDDDIDIAMPRKDYDKLLQLLADNLQEPFSYLHYSIDKKYREYSLKIINKNIVCYEDKVDIEKSKTNLWIDILPLDGVPDNKWIYKMFKLAIYFWKALLSFKNIETIKNKPNRPVIEKILVKFAQIIPIKKLINRSFVMNGLDKTIKLFQYENCKYVGTYMGAYRFKEVVPKRFFGKSSKCDFEGLSLVAPERIDDYLKHMYGDYMKLPPEDKRQTHIVKVEFNK